MSTVMSMETATVPLKGKVSLALKGADALDGEAKASPGREMLTVYKAGRARGSLGSAPP